MVSPVLARASQRPTFSKSTAMPFSRRIFLVVTFFFSLVLTDLTQQGQYDYGFNVDLRLRKREPSQSPIVTGLPRVNGQPPLRLDIRDLEKDKDMWTLYILALNWMQYTDQESPFSWYQITGTPVVGGKIVFLF